MENQFDDYQFKMEKMHKNMFIWIEVGSGPTEPSFGGVLSGLSRTWSWPKSPCFGPGCVLSEFGSLRPGQEKEKRCSKYIPTRHICIWVGPSIGIYESGIKMFMLRLLFWACSSPNLTQNKTNLILKLTS